MDYKPNAPPPAYGMHVPPQPMYNPQQPTVVVNTTRVIAMSLGPESTSTQCPSCHATIRTRTEKEATTKTHILALILCFLCCWPCAIVPYCTDSCRATNHYCPGCGAFLGSFDH